MSRVRAIVLGVAGMVLAAASTSSAASAVQLLEDAGQATAQVWFDPAGSSTPQVQSREGPVRPGLLAQVSGLAFNGPDERSEAIARSRSLSLDGLMSVGIYTSVEPIGLRQPCRGQAGLSFTWRLQVGDAPVNFGVNLWAHSGSSSLYLYDETAGTVVADTGTYQGVGTSIAGQLQAGHTYRAQGSAQADASQGGDPSAGVEFRTVAAPAQP